jgi:hypothetical protein
MKLYLGAFLLLTLQSCVVASVQDPVSPIGVSIAGMVIRNELLYPVTDVMINVPATGAFAGCGNIMPRSECRTSFETVDYSGNPMVVSWKEYGQPQTTGDFVVEPGEGIHSFGPAWLEVTIFAAGQAGAKFIRSVKP